VKVGQPPLVSVLVTTYQHVGFIDEAIASTLNQSYRNLEVVVADDGSTDGTETRLRYWADADPRVVPLVSGINTGLSANWNRGLRRCHGEFVAILSGDDVMLPGRIEQQVAFLQDHPECGVCSHDMEVFESASGKPLYRLYERYVPKIGGPEVMFTTNWLFGRPIKSIPSSHMFRASAIGQFRYPEHLRIMNEWLFEIDCLVTSGLRWDSLPQVLGRYRVHQQQTSTSREASVRGFEESMVVLAIAAARYPQLARLIKNKRDYILFQHLVFGWFAEGLRSAFETEFRVEAGALKSLYMRVARRFVRKQWLLNASRPARRLFRALAGKA
jgi:glycosyltransferase involved in cell wall biosynthesis